MKIKLIKILKSVDNYYSEGKYLFVDEFSNIPQDIKESEVIEEFDIPKNMSLSNRILAETLYSLIDKQEIAIKQCETQIRRLPIRKNILRKLIILNKLKKKRKNDKL